MLEIDSERHSDIYLHLFDSPRGRCLIGHDHREAATLRAGDTMAKGALIRCVV
jgi:hypothetical protein